MLLSGHDLPRGMVDLEYMVRREVLWGKPGWSKGGSQSSPAVGVHHTGKNEVWKMWAPCTCTFARCTFAVVPEAEAGRRCYSTAGTKGWAPGLGGVFDSVVCRALWKALCGQCYYWKLVFSSTAILTLAKQKQENQRARFEAETCTKQYLTSQWPSATPFLTVFDVLVILFPECSIAVADVSLYASVNTYIESCFAISTKKPVSWVFSYPEDKQSFHAY